MGSEAQHPQLTCSGHAAPSLQCPAPAHPRGAHGGAQLAVGGRPAPCAIAFMPCVRRAAKRDSTPPVPVTPRKLWGHHPIREAHPPPRHPLLALGPPHAPRGGSGPASPARAIATALPAPARPSSAGHTATYRKAGEGTSLSPHCPLCAPAWTPPGTQGHPTAAQDRATITAAASGLTHPGPFDSGTRQGLTASGWAIQSPKIPNPSLSYLFIAVRVIEPGPPSHRGEECSAAELHCGPFKKF